MATSAEYTPYQMSIEAGEVLTNLRNDIETAKRTLQAATSVLHYQFPLLFDALSSIAADEADRYKMELQQAFTELGTVDPFQA